MNQYVSKFASKKFIAALITLVVMTVNVVFKLQLDVETIIGLVLPTVAYILGESWTDVTSIKNNVPKTNEANEVNVQIEK